MTAPFNHMHDLLLTECFICDFVEAVSQQPKVMICQYLLSGISGNSMFSFSNFDALTKHNIISWSLCKAEKWTQLLQEDQAKKAAV